MRNLIPVYKLTLRSKLHHKDAAVFVADVNEVMYVLLPSISSRRTALGYETNQTQETKERQEEGEGESGG